MLTSACCHFALETRDTERSEHNGSCPLVICSTHLCTPATSAAQMETSVCQASENFFGLSFKEYNRERMHSLIFTTVLRSQRVQILTVFCISVVLFSFQVKHGHSKLVWCSLVGKVFYYYRNQDDKVHKALLTPLFVTCFIIDNNNQALILLTDQY